MKIILKVGEREMTFSEKELAAIVEKNFSKNTIRKVYGEITKKPTEGKWFEVYPGAISQVLFQKKREDSKQEWLRQIILEAFDEVRKNPKKYARPFETMIPVKKWETKTVEEQKEVARVLGHHMADWVEQALEWAQRITNGESWEDLCNNPDTSKWSRSVIWKDSTVKSIGYALEGGNIGCSVPPISVEGIHCITAAKEGYFDVPLVVRFK